MRLKSMRFLSLLFTTLALGPALAHLLELPNKIHLSKADYLTVQQIYRGWAMLGIVGVCALLSTLLLSIMVLKQRKVFIFTLISLLCIVGTQVAFWKLTYPVNQATGNWTWLPDNWQELRQQWEYSYAAGAILNLMAMVTLILSVLTHPAPKKILHLNAEYFPTSNESEKAQALFLQDVVTFHSSWYKMALDEFRETTKVETDVPNKGLLERSDGAAIHPGPPGPLTTLAALATPGTLATPATPRRTAED